MVYVLIFLSYLFESIMTNIVNMNSFLIPLFLLTSLTILYPYFRGKKINFIIVCTLCGLLYDISFSDSKFINTISFSICSSFIILAYSYVKYSIYSSSIINVVNIVLYRFLSYILLVTLDYTSFNIIYLSEGIYNSILINIIYSIIIYLVADLLSKIFNIKKD